MVDAIVSYVLERLGDYLIREAVFLSEVKNEVIWLQRELEMMQAYIKDAEGKQRGSHLISQWMSNFRDIAYDVEDVLDTFMLKVGHGGNRSKIKGKDEGPSEKRSTRCLPSIMNYSWIRSNKGKLNFHKKGKEVVSTYTIGKEIEGLKSRITDLSRQRKSYGLQSIISNSDNDHVPETLRQLRKVTTFAVEKDVVGFEEDAKKLLDKLLADTPGRFVISIFGMGGLGKTTLAKKLYHNHLVRGKFDCLAWISVSKDYEIHDLLVRIIQSFGIGRISSNDLKMMSEEDLARYLYKSLQGRSYVVVVDDVWKKEAWKILKRAFPDEKNGSRVILTTRMMDVAERSDDRTHVHDLRFLREDESWELFCKIAFRNLNIDKELERCGREMVHKCSGLPLAIVVLGGLLSTKKPHEWLKVRKSIWSHLENDSIEINSLLDLSFDDLSYHLKLVFLYLGLFPEDFQIKVKKLIQLLVAEGIIHQEEDYMMEDVAKNNLDELMNRSLIQIGRRSWGRIVTYQVHDLLRELAIKKARELNFINIYDEANTVTNLSVVSPRRRLAIYFGNEMCLWLEKCNPVLRSLLFFNLGGTHLNGKVHLPQVCTKFTLLRVLEVEGFHIKSLPKEIGNLIQLKYLGLKGTHITKLPSSIVNLQRLQTLNLQVDLITKLPAEIGKLKELRHLNGLFKGPLLVNNLTNLQTLKEIDYASWIELDHERFVNLRELWVCDAVDLNCIAKLRSLRTLWFQLPYGESYSLPSLHPHSHCPDLVELNLYGKIKKLPEDMPTLFPKLQCLSLLGSKLEDDPMATLEKLPNLMFLALYDRCYRGEKMVCRAAGFPRLEVLELDAHGLKEWQVEDGAMPVLRGLNISNDSELQKSIPERLRSIPPPIDDYSTYVELIMEV